MACYLFVEALKSSRKSKSEECKYYFFGIMLYTFGLFGKVKWGVIWQNSSNGPTNTNVSFCTTISCVECICDNLIHWVKKQKQVQLCISDFVAVKHPQNGHFWL